MAPFILSTTSVFEEARSLSLAGSKDISHLFKELLYLFFFPQLLRYFKDGIALYSPSIVLVQILSPIRVEIIQSGENKEGIHLSLGKDKEKHLVFLQFSSERYAPLASGT